MAQRGRKPDYTQERINIISKALAEGKTNVDAARAGGITESTFYEWQNKHPEFSEAVKRAKADYENWERSEMLNDAKKSLKELICGSEYEESKTEFIDDPDNPGVPKVKKTIVTKRRVLPSATAVIFALCNRDPEHWQNRVAQDVNGKIDVEQKGDGVNLSNVPDELLAQVLDSLKGK